jgi:hypothetical protein
MTHPGYPKVRLVTFDRSLAFSAVVGATDANLVVP